MLSSGAPLLLFPHLSAHKDVPSQWLEMGVQKIMHTSIRQLHSALLRINPLQNASILHMKIRMFFRQYPFQLKLDNGNGFVHFPAQLFLKSIAIGRIAMYFKYLAGIIPVNLHGKAARGIILIP